MLTIPSSNPIGGMVLLNLRLRICQQLGNNNWGINIAWGFRQERGRFVVSSNDEMALLFISF
jgi:hypothetical protein